MTTFRSDELAVSKPDEPISLASEIASIRSLVARMGNTSRSGNDLRLGAGVSFLPDGRALCLDRRRGDSRYPYGEDGFTLWVNASGRMSASKGNFFWLLPTEEGQAPPVAAFAGCRPGGEEHFHSLSLLPLPTLHEMEERTHTRYTVIGHDATYYFAETDELLTVVRVLLDQDARGSESIHWSLSIQNLTDHPLPAYSSFYLNPFCRHQLAATSEDRWFKRTELKDSRQFSRSVSLPVESGSARGLPASVTLPSFSIKTNEDISPARAIINRSIVQRALAMEMPQGSQTRETAGEAVDRIIRIDHSHTVFLQHCTSWSQYVGGPRQSLATAEFLKTGSLGVCDTLTTFNDNAIVGDLHQFVLPPNACLRSEYAWSTECDENEDTPPTIRGVERTASRVRDRAATSFRSKITVREGTMPGLSEEVFNHFVPFLQRQVAVCAQIQGYMQSSPNSLIGFRDVMQAVEGRLLDEPELVRERILEALGYMLSDGRCPRQYLPATAGKPALGDLREFVDQGVWAIATVLSYVRTTGDTAILDEQLGYHQPHPSNDRVLAPAEQTDAVIDHLLAIADYLSKQRDPETGLVRALYGDWNDAIDGLGVAREGQAGFGSGVSVMASLQFYQNCEELMELLSLSTHCDAVNAVGRLRTYREQLQNALVAHAIDSQRGERRILHGWGDQQSFLVGGFNDVDGLPRDGLTSNAFWVLSGMLEVDKTLKADLLNAFDRLDSPYGLKTFQPAFGENAEAVGRIVRLPPGAAENGAVYVHATTFAIAALFRMGEPQRAWEQIAKILPFSPQHSDPSHSPFVMPNSYAVNDELNLNGQSMNDWQTGCSNVLWKVLVRYVFGFDPRADRLRVAPACWAPFNKMALQFTVRGRRLKLVRERGSVAERQISWGNPGEFAVGKDTMMGVTYADFAYSELAPEQLNVIRIVDPQ